MINRDVTPKLIQMSKKFPIVSITGPRQSGKTTLAKMIFKNFTYISLEDPDNRSLAENDPRRFLQTYSNKIIIDEAQKAPNIFSYLQTHVDNNQKTKFILTGSQNFLLNQSISQSLSGRIYNIKLLPFSQNELKNGKYFKTQLNKTLIFGSYPRIFHQKIKPQDFFPGYVETYLERDVRGLKNIGNLSTFQRFLTLCATRSGQLLNKNNLATQTGISVNTIESWLSVLEASYIVKRLQPFYRNLKKRVVKSPKIYFYDTGLLIWLLSIRNTKQLSLHPLLGQIFENYIISEFLKAKCHQQLSGNLYFFRDNHGNEVDLIIENGNNLSSVEIKLNQTLEGDRFFKGLQYWQKLTKQNSKKSFLIYSGNKKQSRRYGTTLSWNNFASNLFH